ncbi:MAG TPA: chemotaxis protein CheA, partial [Methylocella sp.]|nr:chemotaxis protein CheA [Methylocella sp.]
MSLTMDAMAAIKQTFFQECEEQLGELETGLLAIDEGDTDPETVNAVFRAVHSIKGGAGAFSLEELVHFAHVFENALDHLRAGRLAPSSGVLKTMLRASDMLADLVRAARDDGAADSRRRAEILSELQALDPDASAGGPCECIGDEEKEEGEDPEAAAFEPVQISLEELEDEAAPAPKCYLIRFTPKPELYAKANEAALLLRGLSQLGDAKVACDVSGIPLLSELDPEGSYLSWTIELRTELSKAEVRSVFEFAEWDCDLEIELQGSTPAGDAAEISALIQQMQANVEAELAARAPAPAETEAGVPAAAGTGSPAQPACAAPPGKAEPAAPQQATIRVDLERVDRLINLVGELVINQAMLTQRVLEAGVARASGVASGLDELEQLTREIQDSVMAIRAQPVKSVFQRMPRLVREVAALTGKRVRLVTEGENTEVDKTVIERLADPLTHMIRNAIDHGLEPPETRAAAGKPEEGLVRLSALHRSGRIVIEVTDDGSGIDRAKVKALAASKGLIPLDAVLPDEEIDNLIFLPGFSTASTVS